MSKNFNYVPSQVVFSKPMLTFYQIDTSKYMYQQHFIHASLCELIEADWFITALLKWVIIGSGNSSSPIRRQAITWPNNVFLSIEPLRTNFSRILIWNLNIFIEVNAFENVSLYQPQCVWTTYLAGFFLVEVHFCKHILVSFMWSPCDDNFISQPERH